MSEPSTVPVGVFIQGFKQAYERFMAARNSADPNSTFVPLFEILNWADVLIDRFKASGKQRDSADDSDTLLRAFNYARNRTHHQWIGAIYLREGVSFPIEFPSAFHEWMWRDVSDLPPPDKGHENLEGKEAYQSLLANKEVRFSLQALGRVFESV